MSTTNPVMIRDSPGSNVIAFGKKLVICAGGALAVGVLIALIYAAPFSKGWAPFGGVIAVGVAAAAVGSILGFLFGVPKSQTAVVSPLQPPPGSPADGLTGKESSIVKLGVNTSLEQIADWLTKILVGLGLTQIGNIPSVLARLANSLAPLFGGTASSPAVALCFSLFCSITAFLLMYLWTRTGLTQELSLTAI